MRSSLVAGAMLAGAAFASPVERESVFDKIAKRQGGNIQWTNPDGGNINIFFSDDTVNYGTMNPVDIINNNVSSSCTTEGLCIIGTTDVGQSSYISGPGLEYEDISYNVDGQYPSWVHNGFIALIAGVMNTQISVSTDNCYSPSAYCNPEAYCPEPTETCLTEYSGPSIIGGVFTGDVGGDSTPGALQVQFTITTDSNSGLCSTLTTIGGTLVGQIPEIGGAASGLFTLAGLGCASA